MYSIDTCETHRQGCLSYLYSSVSSSAQCIYVSFCVAGIFVLRDCRTGGFRGPAWILSMLENSCDAGVFAAKWHMDHMTE